MELNKSDKSEIEVRALIQREDLKEVLSKLTECFGEPFIVKMKTFLFKKENDYARLRFHKGSKKAVFTRKEGDYSDKSRKEINKEYRQGEIKELIRNIQGDFDVCSYIKSTRYIFKLDDFKEITLSNHENLGIFIEVEVITADKSKIDSLHKNVLSILDSLNLEELSPKRYQDMMDGMYRRTLKPTPSTIEEMVIF